MTPWAQLLTLFFLKYLSTKQPFYKALSITVTNTGAVKTDARYAATLKSEALLIELVFFLPFVGVEHSSAGVDRRSGTSCWLMLFV